MQKLGVRGVPAVTDMGERRTLEFRPGDLQQLTSAGITPTAGDSGSIEKRGSMPIPQKAAAEGLRTLQLVVHMAEDHQIRATSVSHPIQGESEILIAPVHGRRLPVAPAGAVGL